MTEGEYTTLWNKNFISVLVFGFITGTANHMITPLLSKYSISLGSSLALAGVIVGLQSIVAMFLRPFSGAASDLLNRKFVMVGSAGVVALACTGYLIFQNITAVIICRAFQGVGLAFMTVARTAYATEYMPKHRIGEGIAFTTFGVILSHTIGPPVGLWVADRWGYSTCFLITLILSLLGALLLGVRPYKHQKRAEGRVKLHFNNLIAVEIIPYALLAGLFSQIVQLGNAFIVLIGDERGIANVALFFTFYSLAALIFRPLSGKMLDKFGLSVLLYPAFIFAGLTLVLIGSARGLTIIIIAGICAALSQGIALPSIQGSSIKRLGIERAGVVAATIYIGQDMLNSLSPMLGAVLVENIGYGNTFYIFAAIIMGIGIPAYTLIQHNEKKRGVV